MAPLAGWLEEHEITVAFFGSPLFRQFAQTLRGGGAFPSLRAIRLGSDTVRKSDVEAYRRHFAPTCILVNGLGATETGTLCKYFIDKDTPITTATVPIGYPLDDMTVLVLGEDDREVGEGVAFGSSAATSAPKNCELNRSWNARGDTRARTPNKT